MVRSVLRFAKALAWAAAFFVVVALVFTASDEALHPVDLTKQCTGVQTSNCLVRTRARVVSVDPTGSSIKVRDDRGSHKLEFSAGHALPDVGTRVTLERWNGVLVSIVELRSERRSHTLDWPSIWLDVILGGILLVIAALMLRAPGRWLRALWVTRRGPPPIRPPI